MKTRQSIFGYIFGDPISEFVTGKVPSKADVVRFWMHVFDERLHQLGNPNKLVASEVGSIIRVVSEALVKVWTDLEKPTRSLWDVETVVRRIVELQLEILKKKSPTKAPETWIENQRSKFEIECDIGYLAPREINPPERLISEGEDEPVVASSSKKSRLEEALYVPPSSSSSESESESNSDSDWSDGEGVEEKPKVKCTQDYPNAFRAFLRMGSSTRNAVRATCALLKDLGITNPAMFPTVGYWTSMSNRLGNTLIGKGNVLFFFFNLILG